MALLFLDGCDLHASHGDILRRWTLASSTNAVDVLTTGGRFGVGAIRIRSLSSEETLTKTLIAPLPGNADPGCRGPDPGEHRRHGGPGANGTGWLPRVTSPQLASSTLPKNRVAQEWRFPLAQRRSERASSR